MRDLAPSAAEHPRDVANVSELGAKFRNKPLGEALYMEASEAVNMEAPEAVNMEAAEALNMEPSTNNVTASIFYAGKGSWTCSGSGSILQDPHSLLQDHYSNPQRRHNHPYSRTNQMETRI